MHVTYVSLLTLFKSASIWDSFDLNCILQKEDLLLKSYLPHECFIENSPINVEFPDNKTGEILGHILCLLLKLCVIVHR